MAEFRSPKSRKIKNTPQKTLQIDGDSLFKSAINCHLGGDLLNAEKFYREAINSGLSSSAVFSNLGIICQTNKHTKEAFVLYKKAIEIDPDHPDAYTNLGVLYKDLGNLDQALTSTLKSLELKPDNSDAHINLGGIYRDLGNLDQALASTLKSLELKPNNAAALMSLGGIYQDLGNLDQALTSTLKSLELRPDSPDAHMNLGMIYEILNELDSALESYSKSAKLIGQQNESSLTSLINTSAILLQTNRIDNAKKTLSNALAITLDKEIALKSVSIKNKKHNNAYLSYLSRLIPEIPHIKTIPEHQILHLGDSHCLAFTNQTIEFKGERCTIKPSLVKGAKAFHLSKESRRSQQKIGFEKRLRQNLDPYKYIFLSFGEIDCREDEGILSYCRKSGKAIQDISKSTAIRYFKWTANSLEKYKDKLVYFGTPAPFRIDPNRGKSSEISKHRLLAITVFNNTLATQCKESGAIFANVYELTADKDGYNSNDWMIDQFHLRPQALNDLIQNL